MSEELEAKPVAYQVGQYRVEYRGAAAWAVVDGGDCLNNSNEWEHEPLPSNRTPEFFERCRFSLPDAINRARQIQIRP